MYDYSVSYNGFAAELTEAQASKLEKVPGVIAVTEDELLQPDTSSTPHFIGLDSPTGLWTRLGGPSKAGENVIIGVVDTGIWPEHPSFSDTRRARSGSRSSPTARLPLAGTASARPARSSTAGTATTS